MRLTRKKAIELCIALWTSLAETGMRKFCWPEWEKYVSIDNHCFFCEYDSRQRKAHGGLACNFCSFKKKYGHCNTKGNVSYYRNWTSAQFPSICMEYAKLFLEQIKELK